MQPAAPAPQYPYSSMQIAKLSASLSSPNSDPTLYPSLASADHLHSDTSSTAYSQQSQQRLWDPNITLNHNDNTSGSLFTNPNPSLSISRVPDLSPGSSTDHSSVRTPLDMQSMPPPLQDMYTGKIISEDDWLHYKAVPAYEESSVGSRPRRTPSTSTTINTDATSSSHDQQSTVSARSAYSSRPSLSSAQFQQQQSAYVPRHSSEVRYPYVSTPSTPTSSNMHTQPQLQAQSSPQVAIPQHSPPNANSSSNGPEGQMSPSHSQFHSAHTFPQQQQKQKPERPRLLIEQPVSFTSHSKSQQASSVVQQQPQQQHPQPQPQVGAPIHNGQQQPQAYPQSQQDFHSRRLSWNAETTQPSSTSSLSHILASSTINPSSNIVLTQEQRWIQQMHLEQQQQAMRQQSLQQQHSTAQYSESNSWVPRTAASNINGSVSNGQAFTVNANLNIALNLGNGVHAYSHHPSQSQQLPPSASGPQVYSTAGGVMGSLQSYGQGQHATMVSQQQRITSQPQYFVSPQQPSGQQRRFTYDQSLSSPQQQLHHQQQRIESPQVFSYAIDSVPPPQQASYQTTNQSVSTFMPIQSNHQQAQSNWAVYSGPPLPYPREPPPPSSTVNRRHSQYAIEPPSTSSSRKRSASPVTETTAVSHGGMVFAAEGAKRRKYSPPSSLNPVLSAAHSAVAQAEDAHARLVSWREEASAAIAAPQEEPIQTRSSASVSARVSSSTRAVNATKGRDANDESDQDAEGEDENKGEDEEDASDYVDDGDDEEYDPRESKSRKTASRSRRGRPPGSTKKATAARSVRATRSTSQAVPTSPTSKPAAKAAPGRRGRQARGS